MNWLLDVNALIALGYRAHTSHDRMIDWLASIMKADARFVTCPITEIGFIRVAIQAGLEASVPNALETLQGLKQSSPIAFEFIPDSIAADGLPTYVKSAKQVTDGYLLALATSASMQLATLDRGIPGAFLIP